MLSVPESDLHALNEAVASLPESELLDSMGFVRMVSADRSVGIIRAEFDVHTRFCHSGGTTAQGGFVTARLHLSYLGVNQAFTTRNENTPDTRVTLKLVDGPFSLLEGSWQFAALAKPGDAAAQACRVEFELRYAFSSMALELLLSPVFDRIANTFVDSFVKRAEQVYGER